MKPMRGMTFAELKQVDPDRAVFFTGLEVYQMSVDRLYQKAIKSTVDRISRLEGLCSGGE